MINVYFENYDDIVDRIMSFLSKQIEEIRFFSRYYNGFLPDNVDSPIKDLCGRGNTNSMPMYLYNLKTPQFCDVRYDKTIRRFGKIIGKVNLVNEEQVVVGSVERICDKGYVDCEEFYDKHGHIFKMNLYDDKKEILSTTFKGNENGEEYIYTPKCDSLICVKEGMVNKSTSWNRYINDYFSERRNESSKSIYIDWIADATDTKNSTLIVTKSDTVLNLNGMHYEDIPFDKILFIDGRLMSSFKYREADNCKMLYLINDGFTQTVFEKNILILTNSDQVTNINEIVKLLHDFHFYIAARTMVSPVLAELNNCDNVSVVQCINKNMLRDLLDKCSIYLDINKFEDVFGVAELAINNEMVLFGYDDTIHYSEVVPHENVYNQNETEEMCRDICCLSENLNEYKKLLFKQSSLAKKINEEALK